MKALSVILQSLRKNFRKDDQETQQDAPQTETALQSAPQETALQLAPQETPFQSVPQETPFQSVPQETPLQVALQDASDAPQDDPENGFEYETEGAQGRRPRLEPGLKNRHIVNQSKFRN